MQIAVVGAGPIGLEAALAAVERGHDVTVFEQGRVAQNVRDWGHVRLFSPFGMNTSERGRAVLREAGDELPPEDALLTGREFVESYLAPLGDSLSHSIVEKAEVAAIGRSRLGKGEVVGSRSRTADRFRLLVQVERYEVQPEQWHYSDVVLDVSGTYPNHRWLGPGGLPSRFERLHEPKIEYRLPDVLGTERGRFAGKHTLVVGSGYSAATTVVALAKLARSRPETDVTWATRPGRSPIKEFEGDTLAERVRLTSTANQLVSNGRIRWQNQWSVWAIHRDGGLFGVEIQDDEHGGVCVVRCDNVIANVGYKPDRSLYEELQIHECYASQGPIKLAASLLGETSGDCLAMESPGPDVLRNPEPNFFILGSKSYGRDSRFLLRTGLQQVEDVFQLIEK